MWYHNHSNKVSKADNAELENMLLDIAGEKKNAPRTMRITQFYSKHYYSTRVKPAFDIAWANERKKPASDQETHIAIRNRLTECAWRAESALFKESVTIQRDEAHKKLVEEFEKKESENKKFPDSAEGYHASVNYKSDHVLVADEFDANSALNGAAALLQPFADLMSKKFGAAVSIMMVCPIGSKNGQIELRRYLPPHSVQTHSLTFDHSVHSGVTKGLVPSTWPEFDDEGFGLAQSSMIKFGQQVFCES